MPVTLPNRGHANSREYLLVVTDCNLDLLERLFSAFEDQHTFAAIKGRHRAK